MELYLPKVYQKSIYTINYSKLLKSGVKCLLYDLDNTIVPQHTKIPPEKAKELFISLKQKGFRIVIFTNSPKMRLERFTSYFNVEGVSSALKPFTMKLRKFLKLNNYKISEVAIIGDQFMTDIKVGNKVGITTVLVNPLSDEEFFFTKCNRRREKIEMLKLESKGLFKKDNFYD